MNVFAIVPHDGLALHLGYSLACAKVSWDCLQVGKLEIFRFPAILYRVSGKENGWMEKNLLKVAKAFLFLKMTRADDLQLWGFGVFPNKSLV